MTRYRVDGVDCAVCAQVIEEGLMKLEGVRSVSLNFATLTLHVDARDLGAVEREARRIEPALALERLEAGKTMVGPPTLALREELLELGLALLIALAGFALDKVVPGLPAWLHPLPFIAAWLLAGRSVIGASIGNIGRGRVFDELFLMSIATMGAILIGQYEEAVGVMIFYRVGEIVQEAAVGRSRRAVRSLLDLRPLKARVRRNSLWVEVAAEELAVGDLALVLPGEALPADGIVEAGEALVDTRSLTGESAPRSASVGVELMAGFISLDGALEIRVARPASESQAARIAQLVEEASAKKATTEKMVTRIAGWYTPAVVALATATALLPPLLIPGASLATWVYRALVMLVISCPCALVLSIPLGYFAGIGGAARAGMLVKGGQTLDGLARVGTAVFDKTGTLTEGVFEVVRIEAFGSLNEAELLGLAAGAEARASHLIARALRIEAERRGLKVAGSYEDFREFPGRGVATRIGGKQILVGNRSLMAELAPGARADELSESSGEGVPASTEVLIAVDGSLAGRILLGDRIKQGSAAALAELRSLGIDRLAMLTGDREGAALAAAKDLGIGDARFGLSPEGKLRELESIMGAAPEGFVMFVGDGTNDAPVLARADIGVALGGGTDAAVEVADVVLVSGECASLSRLIRHARRTKAIIVENIIFAIGAKVAFLALASVGLADMWLAVVADVGVALVAVLNATRALAAPSAIATALAIAPRATRPAMAPRD